MITLRLNRYYGTPNITKSFATFEDEKGNVLMKCEAREGRYVDYDSTVKTPGSATFCLGRGEYKLVVDHCIGNAMYLRIYGDKRRMGFYIMVGNMLMPPPGKVGESIIYVFAQLLLYSATLLGGAALATFYRRQ